MKINLEDEFEFQLKSIGILNYVREFSAIKGRRFRFDFAFIEEKVLIEIQGGIYSYKPSHASASGIRRDCEKANLAVAHGWRLFHFTPDMVRSGEAVRMIEEAL